MECEDQIIWLFGIIIVLGTMMGAMLIVLCRRDAPKDPVGTVHLNPMYTLNQVTHTSARRPNTLLSARLVTESEGSDSEGSDVDVITRPNVAADT
jgi:hypothetical protein